MCALRTVVPINSGDLQIVETCGTMDYRIMETEEL